MLQLLTKQLIEALYTILTILKEIPLLFILATKFIPVSLRQHPYYTHRQAFGVALLRK